MALTDDQKSQIRLYMGWSARFHQFDSALEQALAALDGSTSDETLVLGFVAECQRIDAAIVSAEARLKALKVGTIELTGGGEIAMLRDRGRQNVARMASILGVEVRNDVFSGTLPTARASAGGMVGGGNRQMMG